MKKIFLCILAILSFGLVFNIGYTLPDECRDRPDLSQCRGQIAEPQVIYTSEMVPGAKCVCDNSLPSGQAGLSIPNGVAGEACKGPVASRKYKCEVPTGLAGFQSVFAQIVRLVINIVLLLGVLGIVGLGIAWSLAGGDDIKAKSSLKTWAINIGIGFIILFFFTSILYFLAPWVYK